jgi:hypothetical protein
MLGSVFVNLLDLTILQCMNTSKHHVLQGKMQCYVLIKSKAKENEFFGIPFT